MARPRRIGDPLRDSIGQPDPIILPDPSRLFVLRAGRLRTLADGHPMAGWLRFMADLAEAQQVAGDAMPLAAAVDVTQAVDAGMPPLAADGHDRDPSWRAALAVIVTQADGPALPDQARDVLARLRDADPNRLADDYLRGTLSAALAGEALFVALALQAYFTHRAAALPVASLRLLPQRGLCPVCGSAPVAGVITAAGKAPGTRYLHCGLCATAWNHVRAMCIGCGESRGLALQTIEGFAGPVKAETCDTCHGYAKMLYQAEDMAVEPMADDLATLGLDMLVGEAGWSRLAPNPLILAGR